MLLLIYCLNLFQAVQLVIFAAIPKTGISKSTKAYC